MTDTFDVCLTFSATIKLHSHRDVSVPVPRVNFNVLAFDSREKSVANHAVLISVTCEVLETTGMETKSSTEVYPHM